MAIVGGDWPDERREEFIRQVSLEFEDMPGIPVLDSMAVARRTISSPRMLVAFVCDDVERTERMLRKKLHGFERMEASLLESPAQ